MTVGGDEEGSGRPNSKSITSFKYLALETSFTGKVPLSNSELKEGVCNGQWLGFMAILVIHNCSIYFINQAVD